MKIKELKSGSAVVVKTIGIRDLKDGDSCLVGVKAIFHNGKFLPVGKRLSLIPDLFDDPQGDELVIIKREK